MQWFFKGLLVGRNHHRRAHIDDTQLDGYEVNVGEEQVRRPEILCRRGLGLDSADELGAAGRKAANASTDQAHSRGCPYRPMARPREG